MTAFDSQCDCQFHGVDMDEIRIVLAGLRSEDSIAELCRREGISQSIYYKDAVRQIRTSLSLPRKT